MKKGQIKQSIIQITVVLAIILSIPTVTINAQGGEGFYAVEVEGSGVSLRRRVVRVNGQTGDKEIISGIVSIGGQNPPDDPLFNRTEMFSSGNGPIYYLQRSRVFSFTPPKGFPQEVGTFSFNKPYKQFAYLGNGQLAFFDYQDDIYRVTINSSAEPELILSNAVATSFDAATNTVLVANFADISNVNIVRQSLVDDSTVAVGNFVIGPSINGEASELRSRNTESIFQLNENEFIFKFKEVLSKPFQGNVQFIVILRVNISTGAQTLIASHGGVFGDDPSLTNVLGFTGSQFIIPPNEGYEGSWAPYVLLLDPNTLQVTGSLSTLFPWDSQVNGRIFFSNPGLFELPGEGYFTGLMMREFNEDYTTATDTVLFIQQTEQLEFDVRGTGPDIPEFIGMQPLPNRPGGPGILYLGPTQVIEIDVATGNRTVRADLQPTRFIIGSGVPINFNPN